MGGAMNQHRKRQGVSLLEVIACTALVAVMIVPIAGVIRASGQAIQQSDGAVSTEARLRRGLHWLADAVRDGTIVSVQNRRLTVQPATGGPVSIEVQAGTLVMTDGSDLTVILQDVRDIRFTRINQTTPPNDLAGVTMALRARDPATRQFVTVNGTVGIPTQF
jgi:hypothetical protein